MQENAGSPPRRRARADSLADRLLHLAVSRRSSSSSVVPATPVSSTQPSPLVFSQQVSDYWVGDAIGYGSSAVVYRALYKPLQLTIAIKMMELDAFERHQIDELRRELQIMTLCRHPHVLPVYGSFVHESKLYVLMPYVAAGSCLDLLRRSFTEGLEEVWIATILKQSLSGLDYLHRNGHLHRDVKAGNLLMGDDGTVYLADFGVSSSLTEHGERKSHRRTFVGTPCWMAPEVLSPENGYDYKADMWSFGITAIELATGQAPLSKYPPLKVLMMILSQDPPTLDRENTKNRFSKQFKDFTDQCLQKDPTKRPTAEKLLQHSFLRQARSKEELAKFLSTISTSTSPAQKASIQQHLARTASTGPVDRGVSWDFSNGSASDPEDTDDITPLPSDTEQVDEGATPSRQVRARHTRSVSTPAAASLVAPSQRRGRFQINMFGSADASKAAVAPTETPAQDVPQSASVKTPDSGIAEGVSISPSPSRRGRFQVTATRDVEEPVDQRMQRIRFASISSQSSWRSQETGSQLSGADLEALLEQSATDRQALIACMSQVKGVPEEMIQAQNQLLRTVQELETTIQRLYDQGNDISA